MSSRLYWIERKRDLTGQCNASFVDHEAYDYSQIVLGELQVKCRNRLTLLKYVLLHLLDKKKKSNDNINNRITL